MQFLPQITDFQANKLFLSNSIGSDDFTKQQNTTSIEFANFVESKSYVPIVGCLYDHLVTTKELTHLQKLFYLITDALSLINLQTKGSRAVALPGSKLAIMLGCSRRQVYNIQKTLEDKGYLSIIKEKNSYGQNNCNLITPTIPQAIFPFLDKALNRVGAASSFNAAKESTKTYLERTKLFVPLNYQLLKTITSNKLLTAQQKVVWLDCYVNGYKTYLGSGKALEFSFIASYQELMDRYDCTRPGLSKIMNTLRGQGFIAKNHIFLQNGDHLQHRQDKSLWQFAIALPPQYAEELSKIKDRSSFMPKPREIVQPQQVAQETIAADPSTQDNILSKLHHAIIQTCPYINKDLKTKKINKNRSSKSNFFKFSEKENEPSSQKLNQRKNFQELHPISKEDAIALRQSSGRDFAQSYINKLILLLAKKYPGHGFYTKQSFLKYMTRALIGELRQTTQVNNVNFKFKQDKQASAREKYLEEVETSRDTSLESQLRRKIAGRFDSEQAYQLLISCKFKGIEEENGKIFMISVRKQLNLNHHHEEMILQEVRAVYGDKIEKLKLIAPYQAKNKKEGAKSADTEMIKEGEELKNIDQSSIWYKVGQALLSHHGSAIYRSWFGKLEAEENASQKTIRLKAPTDFIASWIQSNYFWNIRDYCRQENYQLLEIK